MSDNNKKLNSIITIIVASIAIVISMVFMCIRIKNKSNKNTSNNVIENTLANEIEENIVIENIIENDVIEDEALPTVNASQEISEDELSKEKNDLDKAIEIVKKDWGGEENSVFRYEKNDSDGRYIIAVRDKKTLNAICYYHVNIETGEFEIKN